MTTITLKINERTKKGKAFLELAHAFFENSEEIEIIKTDAKKTTKEKAPNKLMSDLEKSFREVTLAQEGKLHLNPLEQLLNEK